MHEPDSTGTMKWQEVLMQEMGENLTENQKKTLMKRMVDEKILLKTGLSEALPIQDRDYEYGQAYAGSDLQVNR